VVGVDGTGSKSTVVSGVSSHHRGKAKVEFMYEVGFKYHFEFEVAGRQISREIFPS